jgi:hypothetical protein
VVSWATSSWTFALNKYLGGKAISCRGRARSLLKVRANDEEPVSAPDFYTKRLSTIDLSRSLDVIVVVG